MGRTENSAYRVSCAPLHLHHQNTPELCPLLSPPLEGLAQTSVYRGAAEGGRVRLNKSLRKGGQQSVLPTMVAEGWAEALCTCGVQCSQIQLSAERQYPEKICICNEHMQAFPCLLFPQLYGMTIIYTVCTLCWAFLVIYRCFQQCNSMWSLHFVKGP